MKNLMLIAVMLFPAFLFAQITIEPAEPIGEEMEFSTEEVTESRPKYFIGGELLGNGNSTLLDFNVKPRFGYFLTEKVVLGVYSKRTKIGFLRPRDVGVFARYYFPMKNLTEKSEFWGRWSFFGELAAENHISIEGRSFDLDIDIQALVGANIKLTDKLFLEASVAPGFGGITSVNMSPRIGLEMRFGTKQSKR